MNILSQIGKSSFKPFPWQNLFKAQSIFCFWPTEFLPSNNFIFPCYITLPVQSNCQEIPSRLWIRPWGKIQMAAQNLWILISTEVISCTLPAYEIFLVALLPTFCFKLAVSYFSISETAIHAYIRKVFRDEYFGTGIGGYLISKPDFSQVKESLGGLGLFDAG